jgi:3-keto-disaccharide hydrolase
MRSTILQMNLWQHWGLALAMAGLLTTVCFADPKLADAEPKTVDPDFSVQGEYLGTLKVDGESQAWGAQVIALSDGKFHAVGLRGGLPGDGWDAKEKREVDGEKKKNKTVFHADHLTLEIEDGRMSVVGSAGEKLGTLRKKTRKSPTLGAKPPADALVLFDGTSPDAFIGGRMSDERWLIEGAESKRRFDSFHLHFEFRLPFMPAARQQDRGNSGCYCQGRYEVQILDSFALKGHDNECGAIYHVAAPKINMCYPPLSWQTYDIDYVAAQYDGDRKVKNARITVKHNGVLIHQDQQLPHVTRASPLQEGPEPGPLYLQDHGCQVRYRNVWIQEKAPNTP